MPEKWEGYNYNITQLIPFTLKTIDFDSFNLKSGYFNY